MTYPTSAPALVIGGSGFIGGAIMDALIAQGRPVRALARSAASADVLRQRGAAPIPGDLLNLASLVRAMEGCAVVYHAAGVNAFCVTDPGPMERANVDGSANVVTAAAKAGARRVVYTSSAAAIGEATGTVGTEFSRHRGWFLSEYERTKYLAENRVRHEASLRGVGVVCVCPSSVQGPGRLHGTARLLLRYLNGRLKFLVDTPMSFVDIADCTAGHLLAESHGSDGERYILNGASMTTRELIRLVSACTGLERRVRWLPGWSAMAGAAVVEAAAKALRRDPPVCRELIRTLLHGHTYDGSRAQRELGLHYTSVHETISATLRWYAGHGYLAQRRAGP